MAKKQAPQFEGMEDTTPPELIDLGLTYKKCQLAEGKAKEKTKDTMSRILEKMHELKVSRFRLEVDGNMKWLTINPSEKLKWEKSETAPKLEE